MIVRFVVLVLFLVLSVELRSSDYARAVGVKYEEECRFFVLITRRVLLTRVPVRVRLSRVAPASFFFLSKSPFTLPALVPHALSSA